jgi:hypothetical protein
MKNLLTAAVCALVAVVLSACSSGDSSSNSSGFTLPTITTTETFSGTVDVGGSAFHPFTVGGSGGTLNVTLTAAGPPATIFMGLGVGTPSAATATAAASCPLLANASLATPAGTTAQLSGTIGPGNYCVAIFDVGNQTAQISYTVTVSHP